MILPMSSCSMLGSFFFFFGEFNDSCDLWPLWFLRQGNAECLSLACSFVINGRRLVSNNVFVVVLLGRF